MSGLSRFVFGGLNFGIANERRSFMVYGTCVPALARGWATCGRNVFKFQK